MRQYFSMLAIVVLCSPSIAHGKCADEIAALQGKPQGTDAATKPGSQQQSTSPGTNPSEGGGQVSASEKLLEAQAHDQKGDEAACMKAIDEAKGRTSK